MLIVGLGNPGSTYASTRHNVGFMVIDELCRRHSVQNVSKSSFEGELFKMGSHFLLKPTTYMNLSGRSILAVKNFYKVDEVIVIHDDLDLPFGALRFKKGGGHGGHNGLKSADGAIGADYVRVRMGIGKPEHKSQVADYVLHAFNPEEGKKLPIWIQNAADAVEMLLIKNVEEVASKCSIKG
ncbi:MAG: aminoacyl-tRNA hydrolase [Sulfuricurvum sp.]|uniref:aminoacyl-tRNA hydrolase n=1 Tax=Sulfuricurvum sp. TaxID=2025608 RepID=UPI00262B6359|nr:aminoacyl-tRNA hydrolase [Sulfuricurvum sp.]MDD2837594.1 aminoacyl-tRNA hydrolase [Sulfuricurvum sp.]MDD3595534.1 aminoacyl-tRNA hydrolase [Sulfuricurvum sp.]MDD4883669.1 aminoacyl-tRNA hydrolase [Sulfuricurvum sp.]